MFFLFGVAFLVLNACQDSYLDGVEMKYEEKKCDNPWEALPEQGNYIVEVRGFLESHDIRLDKIEIEVYDKNASASCATCDCTTGRNIVISIPTRFAKNAEAVGFVLID